MNYKWYTASIRWRPHLRRSVHARLARALRRHIGDYSDLQVGVDGMDYEIRNPCLEGEDPRDVVNIIKRITGRQLTGSVQPVGWYCGECRQGRQAETWRCPNYCDVIDGETYAIHVTAGACDGATCQDAPAPDAPLYRGVKLSWFAGDLRVAA